MITLKSLSDKFGAWMRYRRAVDELSRFTDRELHDIGLCRDDILVIAANAARETEPVYPFVKSPIAKPRPAARTPIAKSAGSRTQAWAHQLSSQLP